MPFFLDWGLVILGSYGVTGLVVFSGQVEYRGNWEKITHWLITGHLLLSKCARLWIGEDNPLADHRSSSPIHNRAHLDSGGTQSRSPISLWLWLQLLRRIVLCVLRLAFLDYAPRERSCGGHLTEIYS